MAANFQTLERGDDWGRYYYTEPGKRLTEHGTASAALGLPLHDGLFVRVLWPNGSTTRQPLKSQKYIKTISDHGQRSEITGERWGVSFLFFGLEHWVELTQVKIDVEPLIRNKTTKD